VMKLQPNVTFGQLRAICEELGSADSGRFSGVCKDLQVEQLGGASSVNEQLAWSFQGFSVKKLVSTFSLCSLFLKKRMSIPALR